MIIISDSSVLINLAKVGYLHLVPSLYEHIIIPTAVYEEIVIYGKGKAGVKEIEKAKWIEVVKMWK